MGTIYNVKVVSSFFTSKSILHRDILERLFEITSKFSTYNESSEINQFNDICDLNEKFYPSDDFFDLLIISKKLYEICEGSWDPSIGPLVNAWGFGSDSSKNQILKEDEVKVLLDKVNFKNAIIFCDDGSIKKGFIDTFVDLASIAKGFGVDQIALLLKRKGFDNFLVEIGGELYAKGLRRDKQLWSVGLVYPSKEAFSDKIYKIIHLSDKAIATSGDYRNFMTIDNDFYCHIIDPRSGFPIKNNVTSVSVVAENCTIADGLATALMVMVPKESIKLVNNLPLVECIVTVLEDDGYLKEYSSDNFGK